MESFREFVNDSWQPFGRSTDVQVIGLNRVLFVGLLTNRRPRLAAYHRLLLGPAAEVVDLAANLLHPLAAAVRRERELAVRLLRCFTTTGRGGRNAHGASSAG